MGLLHPSNLLSLLPSSWPRGQHVGCRGQLSAPPSRPGQMSQAAQEGRWELLGTLPWFPPGIASTSLFLRLFPSFQAKVCCWSCPHCPPPTLTLAYWHGG